MRITLTAPLTFVLTLVLASSALRAQQPQPPAGPQDVLAQLRSRDVLSAADQANLRQAIEQQVQAMVAAEKANDDKDLAVARRNLSDAPGQGASAMFRTTFADVAGPVFQPYLGIGNNAGGDQPRVALYLIQVLGELNQPSSLNTLTAALQSKYPAVRYWAARAIRDMRAEIASRPGGLVDTTIAALRAAGVNEGYPPAAQTIYQAIDFRGPVPAAAPQVYKAWLDMLEARLGLYNNPLVSDLYPDAEVLAALQAASGLSDGDKARAVQIAHSIIENCAQRWADVARPSEDLPVDPENPYDPYSVRQWHLRYQLVRTAQEAESLMRKLSPAAAQKAGQTPDVASLMTNLATTDQVKQAAAGWGAILQAAPATDPAAEAAAPGAQG